GNDSGDGLLGDLDIVSQNLTIIGAGANKTTIDASLLGDRAFEVLSGAGLNLTGVTITGGNAMQGGGILNHGNSNLQGGALSGNFALADGGPLFNDTKATLAISNSTLSNNAGWHGGAVDSAGTLTIKDSTFSGNQATGGAASGGAIYTTGTTTIQQSTVVHN